MGDRIAWNSHSKKKDLKMNYVFMKKQQAEEKL